MERRKWSLEEDYYLPSPTKCKGSWFVPFGRFYSQEEPTTYLLALRYPIEGLGTVSVEAIDASLLRDASPFLEDVSWRPFWRGVIRREIGMYSTLLSNIARWAETSPDEWAARYRKFRCNGAKLTF